MVLLADGSAVPIEDVEVGDEVVATDPETGETAGREVTNLHLNVDTDLTRLTVADAATGERSVLETTQNHPFWDATVGEWVDASKLTPGHRLRSACLICQLRLDPQWTDDLHDCDVIGLSVRP